MTETGIDGSHHNGTINWPAVVRSGIDFAYAKCTEAADPHLFVDSQYTRNRDGARANGITFGAYHFGRPASDPVKAAQQFMDAAGWRRGDLPPMLDLEASDGYSPAHCKAWAKAFIRALGQPGGIYTGHWFWTTYVTAQPDALLSSLPLWLGPDHPQPPCWADHTIAQTYNASIPGVSGPCDFNTIKLGSLADLVSYAGGGSPSPSPDPAPAGKDVFDTMKYAVIFVTHGGHIYAAHLLSGTYMQAPNQASLDNMHTALDNAEIGWRDGGPVDGLDRYGREVAWGPLS